MPRIEWKLDMGHVITIVVVLVSLAVNFGGQQAAMSAMHEAIAEMKALSRDQESRLRSVEVHIERHDAVLERRR